jgi:nucleoside phosphorylase
MIAVTFALPAESSGLVARLRDRERSNETNVIRGKIDNHSVAILHTGVGRKSCESKIDNFLGAEQPSVLIAAGFAGAVREHLQAGDLILGENFSDLRLLADAQRILSNRNVRPAKLFTSPTIVDSIAERNEVARASGADAVEMEAEFVARACAKRGVRMLSLRAVSDSPRHPFPAPPNVLFDIQRQKTDVAKLLTYLAMHPLAILRLIRFDARVRKARETLTNAIVDLVPSLRI